MSRRGWQSFGNNACDYFPGANSSLQPACRWMARRSTVAVQSELGGEQHSTTSMWDGLSHESKHKGDSGLGRRRVRATEAVLEIVEKGSCR